MKLSEKSHPFEHHQVPGDAPELWNTQTDHKNKLRFRILLNGGAHEEVRLERWQWALPHTSGLPRSHLVSNPVNKEGPGSSSGAPAFCLWIAQSG
jgi:hypothetical protein